MCRHADLDGAGPLVHHLVDTHLEHLVGTQRAAAQDHTVVKVVRRTARVKRGKKRRQWRQLEEQEKWAQNRTLESPPKKNNSCSIEL